MLEEEPRFDMTRPPMRMHLKWLIWLLSFPAVITHKNKLTKVNMEGIKPPYLLLCNHNAFMDFKVAMKGIFPHGANFVVAIDGFLKREWLLRFIGCICKRKFTNDLSLIRQLKRVVDRGDIAAIYPEARYSLCGTTAVLPPSLGKLCKLLKVPVVVLVCHGHHVNSPFWALPDRKVKGTQATMTCLYTADQVKELPHEELTRGIEEAFKYDDFSWQKENGIRIRYKKRAEGLHKVLYQCPACRTEYRMSSSGIILRCDACGKEWEMDEFSELHARTGETEFAHIPDWYEWERMNVRAEVQAGTYGITLPCHVDSLPNPKRYINIGKATLTHNMQGFRLEGVCKGEPYVVEIPAKELYSCHIEYEYLGKFGDCIDLNTLKDTLYIYPEGKDFAVTKFALATEELFYRDGHAPLPVKAS